MSNNIYLWHAVSMKPLMLHSVRHLEFGVVGWGAR